MAALFFLTGFTATGCRTQQGQVSKPAARPVKVFTVSEAVSGQRLSLPGKTRACRRADISFKVAGPLEAFWVEEGQQVAKGQVVARIDSRDFETELNRIKSALSEARARFRSMKNGARTEDIRMLESALDAAQARYRFARDQYKRSEQLWAKQYISRLDYDRHISLRDAARAALETAHQDLAKGKNGARKEDVEAMASRIRGLETQLKAARDALADACLTAPFEGVVARRYVENHQEVQAKQPIVLLEDITEIEILVDLPEALMARINGQWDFDMSARFAVAPHLCFPLSPKEFSTHADPRTQTFQVVLTMPRPKGLHILPGMTAVVELGPISPASKEARIKIPAGAVTRDPQGNFFVWRMDETKMRVNKQKVQVGPLTGSDGIVILGGLAGGDRIVTAGLGRLQDGMAVRVWNGAK